MRKRFILKIIFFFIVIYYGSSIKGVCQDIQFSQFYSNVLYLNPAFAGNAHATRLILHQRIQWPSLDAKYLTSSVSIDHYFNKLNSGIGLMVMKDWQGTNNISSTEIAGQYAYELHLNDKLSFRAGIQAAYATRNINYAALTFPDQYNTDGYIGPTNQPYGAAKINYLDLTTGGILYSDHFWGGITYAHLNQPNQSFYNERSYLPGKIDLTAGYRFDFESKDAAKIEHRRDIYLTPTIHYKAQGKSDQLDLGIYGLYDHLIVGFWYRGIPLLKQYEKNLQNNESIVAQTGVRIDRLSFCYSYDFTVSRLTPARTGGSHEFNVTYFFGKITKKRRPMKKIPCPTFFK